MNGFRGILVSFDVVDERYPTLAAEILKQECDCHGMGYMDRGEVWFICPYHVGVWDTMRTIQ